MAIKSFLAGINSNRGGKTVHEKLVIIESDDWGSIRTPSKEAVKAFENKGLEINKSVFKVDALASGTDLDDLFEVLSKYKGVDGKPAIITANTIVANPDFRKIKESGFQKYYYEPFTETFLKYPEHHNNLNKWFKGIDAGIFQPQFHGREHLDIKRWMKALQSGETDVLYCFEWGATYSGHGDYSFMGAFDSSQPEDSAEYNEIINDGVNLFKTIFGFRPKSFIAPCYNWDDLMEKNLKENGIECIQGIIKQYIPTDPFGSYKPKRHYFGEKNKYGQFYNIRNCFFEPSFEPSSDWVKRCLTRISVAFNLNKPAVISSHRINYVGYIDPANKSRGLKALDELLSEITRRWPTVKFISTDELSNFINYHD